MKILADENVPGITVRALKDMGHDVSDLRGTDKEGSPDDAVWKIAQEEGRVLLTTDRGFASRRGEDHHGILLVCLKRPSRLRIHERALLAFGQFAETQWPGLVVMMRDTVQSVYRRRSI